MSQLPWFVARAAGLVAWGLATASVIWGLTLSSKLFGRRPRPAWLLDLHRYLGGLATIFTGVHIVAIVADSYTHFDLAAVLVPFASSWRPAAVAWGVVGLYLLLAVELTSLARAHLPRRVWRMTHMASFPLFVVATVHALTAGSDTSSWIFEGVVGLSVIVIGSLIAARVSRETPAGRGSGRPAPEGARLAFLPASHAHPGTFSPSTTNVIHVPANAGQEEGSQPCSNSWS